MNPNILSCVHSQKSIPRGTPREYESLLGLCDFIIANRPGIRADALKVVIPPDLLAATRRSALPSQN
jgi:hypothetical protein